MTDSQRWFVLCLTLVVVAIFYLLAPILFPFLIGILLAYIGDPLADRLERAGLSRTLSVVAVFTAMTLIFVLALLLLLPQLGRQIENLVGQIPLLFNWLKEVAIPWLEQLSGQELSTLELDRVRQLVMENWRTGGDLLTQLLGQASRSGMAFAGWLVNLTLIPVVGFYLLRDWDRIMTQICDMLPRSLEPRVSRWAQECDEVLAAFIRGQLLVMLCLGAFYSIGLGLVGLKLALILGVVAGLASIVPYMGFIIGIGASLIAALLQFNDPYYLLLVGAVFAAGQVLEAVLLTPVLVGDKIGLHPVAVIFAIMAGGQLFGFTGVLLALPIAAVIMVLLRHLHQGYRDSGLYQTDADSPPIPLQADSAAGKTAAGKTAAGKSAADKAIAE
tara:strand:- start:8 stop:1168 length:1161 start_codon:yes stop_codon:yes gene_type:complete